MNNNISGPNLDNTSLLFYWAQRNAEHIVPLYCFDPRHYVGTYNYNLPKTGPFRLRFLLDSIRDLRNTLRNKGSNLVVRRGKPEDVVADLIKQLGSVSTVAFQEEVTSEELNVEKKVKDVCAQMKVKVHSCWGTTLYHRDDLPFHHISRLPDVYTQFRKAVETQSRVRPVFPTPEQLKPLPSGLEEGAIPTAEDLQQTEPVADPRSAFPCAGGESQALGRVKHYFWDTAGHGLHFTQVYLSSDPAVREGADSQSKHILVDHDVCSNYGNWLYSAGIGNDPRENRKFNMIKQGLDYDNNGDYVRQWLPELQKIRGSDVHTPWTLSSAALSHAQVSLGETYPTPIIIAPEWSRHGNKKPSGTGPSPRGKKGPSHTPKQHRDRGIDFYFSRSKNL
eukprot:superscaffoldBa00000805_g7346